MPDQDKEHPISPDIVHFENVLDRLVYVPVSYTHLTLPTILLV